MELSAYWKGLGFKKIFVWTLAAWQIQYDVGD